MEGFRGNKEKGKCCNYNLKNKNLKTKNLRREMGKTENIYFAKICKREQRKLVLSFY